MCLKNIPRITAERFSQKIGTKPMSTQIEKNYPIRSEKSDSFSNSGGNYARSIEVVREGSQHQTQDT